MPTEAQRDAQRRYYAKIRDARMAQMRERNAKAKADRLQWLAEHPEGWEEIRAKAVEKYYKGVVRRNRDKIDGWLADPRISETFKAFLRTNVVPVADKGLPKKFLDMCWDHLAIASAVNPSINTIPVEVVDGPTAGQEAS